MDREKVIQEQRTIQAMKKGYMGLEGKFAFITKYLGYPIIQQGGLLNDFNYMNDYWYSGDEENSEYIAEYAEDESSYEIGYAFDGLNRGINLSIVIKIHNREIKVEYENEIVYKEYSGELESYVPNDIWENKIEQLFSQCQKKQKDAKPLERKRIMDLAENKRKHILDQLRKKWGI